LTSWLRLRLALPLFGLSALFLTAALAGAVAWWSTSDPLERILTVVICLLLSTGLTFSVAVAIGPRSSQIPWARVESSSPPIS
jgi:hypothetical protein